MTPVLNKHVEGVGGGGLFVLSVDIVVNIFMKVLYPSAACLQVHFITFTNVESSRLAGAFCPE